jgi:hypothetical protein
MPSLVIVAIPAKDDYVHKISSQKVPHLTLLFLGEDASKIQNFNQILDFVGHASERSLLRFGLEVDRRGELGEEHADVLFFSKSKWSGFETINDFRSYLLKDDNIRTAYDSTEQFPEWLPHLTLGFPDTPAKSDERDYPGISYVNFDRIAVWFGDYEGIEFPLSSYQWDMDVAMGNISSEIVPNILSHYGKKGMRWGVRTRSSSGPESVVVTDKRKRVKTSGGRGFPAHSDAVRARVVGQTAKKSGVKALSNQELQDYAKRIQLEQNVKRLSFHEKSAGKRFVLTVLGQSGKVQAQELSNDASAKVKTEIIKKIAKGK